MARLGFTVFSSLTAADLPAGGWRRAALLCGESAAFAALGMAVAHVLRLGQGGVVSVFLSSAALATRFDEILHENRRNVWDHLMPGWEANRLTALSVLAMFAGVLGAYVAVAAWLGEARLVDEFGFALRAAGLGSDTVLTRRFGTLSALLLHNGLVLVAFAVLGWFYRSYGALLALCWNACVWGVVLTVLVRRATGTPGASPWLAPLSVLALLPHLLLEASAHVTMSLGAIFLSRGLFRYELGDPRMRRVARASLGLMLIAALLVLLAGIAEAHLAPALLGLIAP